MQIHIVPFRFLLSPQICRDKRREHPYLRKARRTKQTRGKQNKRLRKQWARRRPEVEYTFHQKRQLHLAEAEFLQSSFKKDELTMYLPSGMMIVSVNSLCEKDK